MQANRSLNFFVFVLILFLFFFCFGSEHGLHRHPMLPSQEPFYPFKNTHAHICTPTPLLWVLTQLIPSHTQTTDTHSTHILTPPYTHLPKTERPCRHMHTQTAWTHTFPTVRAHWGKSSSNAAHLPVARKRTVASRSWGDILTFISLSVGLKAEKSCFLSRWVIFFFVLLSAEEGKLKVECKTQTKTFYATGKGWSTPLHRFWASPPGSQGD